MYKPPDLTPLIWLSVIGAAAIAGIVGWLGYFLISAIVS